MPSGRGWGCYSDVGLLPDDVGTHRFSEETMRMSSGTSGYL